MDAATRESLVDLVLLSVPGWDEATVRGVFPIDDETVRLRYQEEDYQRRGAPEIMSVLISLDDWTISEALEAVERRLGGVHQVTGGPLSLRWRLDDDRIVILEEGHRRARLHIAPLAWTTYTDMEQLQAEIPDYTPYRWYVEYVRPPNGIYFPAHIQPKGRDQLIKELRVVCASLVKGALLLPEHVMKRGSVTLTSPELLRRANGLPYRPRVDFVVHGDPYEMSVSFDHKEIASSSKSPDTDLPEMMETMMRAWSDWTVEVDEILITVYATSFTPGKRRPNPVIRKAGHLTLGGVESF